MPASDVSVVVLDALRSDDRFSCVTGKPLLSGALRGSYRVFVQDALVASVGVLEYAGRSFVRVIPETTSFVREGSVSLFDHVEHVYRTLWVAGVPAEPYHAPHPAV